LQIEARAKECILMLTPASVFLVLSKFVGFAGALVAAILLWSDHRWWAVAAIATVALQLLLRNVPRVDIFADSAGTGLLVFALTENAWLAIAVAVLDAVLSVVCKNLVVNTFQRMHSDIIAGTWLTPEQIRKLQALGIEDTAPDTPTMEP
jgi:hypothetical protein